MFTYLKYFFYIAWNWNIRLAWFVVRDEMRGEKKYHLHTTGQDSLSSLAKKDIDTSHATSYMPAGYYMLETLLAEVNRYPHNKHFLDIGCGKGRAMVVAAYSGFTNITGIDFSKEFCEATGASLKQIPFKNIKTTVHHNDAFYYRIPAGVEVIFMFNPFDEVIMSGVIENISMSLEEKPRTIYLIYMNPQHKELFIDAGFKTVYEHHKLKYLEGIIMKKGG